MYVVCRAATRHTSCVVYHAPSVACSIALPAACGQLHAMRQARALGCVDSMNRTALSCLRALPVAALLNASGDPSRRDHVGDCATPEQASSAADLFVCLLALVLLGVLALPSVRPCVSSLRARVALCVRCGTQGLAYGACVVGVHRCAFSVRSSRRQSTASFCMRARYARSCGARCHRRHRRCR